jgi:hypothetical protein
MPDIFFDSIEALPEEWRSLAKQDETTKKFSINLNLNSKVTEFRDTNISVSRERDELKAAYAKVAGIVGDDATKFTTELAELRTTAQKVKDGSLKAPGDIEKAVSERTNVMRGDYEDRLKALQGKVTEEAQARAELNTKFKNSVRNTEIAAVVLGANSAARPEALDLFQQAAAGVFEVDDNGQLVAKVNGKVIYGSNGVDPMSPKEWLDKSLTERPYLNKASNGGGAGGGSGGKLLGGLSVEQINAMSPSARIAWANKQTQNRGGEIPRS